MTGTLVLFGVAVVSWVFRIMFTALVPAERLPGRIRTRMDAVGTAAFAALLGTHLTGTAVAQLPATGAAIVAAAVAARRTGSHVVAVGAAAGVWTAVTMLW